MEDPIISPSHEIFMEQALKLARIAFAKGDVPVGAVVVMDNSIIGKGYNQIEELCDATAHAEMIALSAACSTLNTWRLEHARIYITIEPCIMCAGAILNSRIKSVFYGASEARSGACGSFYDVFSKNPVSAGKMQLTGGILEDECRTLMQNFFKKLRLKGEKKK
ncbi:MAG: tRNA adenosine(34) deaminase TadA [bacterium]